MPVATTKLPPAAALATEPPAPAPAAGGFSYARYVPPRKPASNALEGDGAVAKRKLEADDEGAIKVKKSKTEQGNSAAQDSGPKKKKNRRKRKQRTRGSECSDSSTVASGPKAAQDEVAELAQAIAAGQVASDADKGQVEGELGCVWERLKWKECKEQAAVGSKKQQTEGQVGKKKREKKEEQAQWGADGWVRHKGLLERKEKALELASMMGQETSCETEAEAGQVHGLEGLPQAVPVEGSEVAASYATLPAWLAAPMEVEEGLGRRFGDLGIASKVCKALEQRGISEAFAVQSAAIGLLLPSSKRQAGDVLICASTGSGKTLGYGLPLMEDMSQGVVTRLRALVVLPTRELVKQAHEVLAFCAGAYQGTGRKTIRVGMAAGNQSLRSEQDKLVSGERRYGGGDDVVEWASRVDVLVCTPGRLVEHVEQTAGFGLDDVRWLIVDEADKLLGQSYQAWLGVVQARLGAVRKVIVSATLQRDVGLVSQLGLRRPTLLAMGDGAHRLPAGLREVAVRVADCSLKPLYLLALLRRHGLRHALVFTKSNEAALRLARLLALLDASLAPSLATMTSTTPTHQRRKTLRAFAEPEPALRLLLASDLVARGIDIAHLGHVINYDVPPTLAAYVHRVGRTARAARPGCAWTLVGDAESGWFWRCIGKTNHVARAAPVARLAVPDLEPEAVARYHEALRCLGAEAHETRRP
ncbi:hypothetical protein CDD81_7689 [Ophiocordyceps australis]|uniref:ATP-dependent RNA helicase n=1 Tax=Ophiocordyceps australis TaxID=1399860 RepID=A0A2C5XGQ3_9HYPO|nr:hypothetical protein CDD81_7689 [Ophiocordyceps australis]